MISFTCNSLNDKILKIKIYEWLPGVKDDREKGCGYNYKEVAVCKLFW